jgi:dUTP pyrophosphatase
MKIRGFELVSNASENARLPQAQTKTSAGYDIYIKEDVTILPHQKVVLWTDVKAYMLPDEVLEIYIRSSIGFKGLVLTNAVGIIDSDYYNNQSNEGNIGLAVINTSDRRIELDGGMRLAQGIFKKYLTIDGDNRRGERTGGHGSTNA